MQTCHLSARVWPDESQLGHFNTSFTTTAAGEEEDVGYNAMQVNYELLTKHLDPQDVLRSMFSHKLISLKEKRKIASRQEQSGRRHACEEMLDILLNNWKTGTYERFIQVLEKSNYKECAAQLQSNKIITRSVYTLEIKV